MIFKDYYKILGLDTNKVSEEQIRISFREQAKKYHPDVNISKSFIQKSNEDLLATDGKDKETCVVESKKAEERFKDINEAYRILSHPSSKRRYDRTWNTHIGKKQAKIKYEESKKSRGSLFNDFTKMFFGGELGEEYSSNESQKSSRRVPIKGENVETEINIGIDEAFYGQEKKLSLRTIRGNMKTFTIKIPSGIRNGEKIRLIGQGKSGINGGKSGDLFIKINIQNNTKFKLEGYDLLTDLYLSPWEAALGKRVNINSIEETVSLYIPPGIQSGEKIKIPQKGYKDGQGSRGDLIAEIKTVVPKKLSDEEKELFERLGNISKFNPRT